MISKKVVKVPASELLYIDTVVNYSPEATAKLSPRSRKNLVACKFKYSFTLHTESRQFKLFA